MQIHRTAATVTVVLTALVAAMATVMALFIFIPRFEMLLSREVLIANIFQHTVGALSFAAALFLAFGPKYADKYWFVPRSEPSLKVLLVFAGISLIYTTNTLSLFFPNLATYAGGRLLAALVGAVIVIAGLYHELTLHMDKSEIDE